MLNIPVPSFVRGCVFVVDMTGETTRKTEGKEESKNKKGREQGSKVQQSKVYFSLQLPFSFLGHLTMSCRVVLPTVLPLQECFELEASNRANSAKSQLEIAVLKCAFPAFFLFHSLQ